MLAQFLYVIVGLAASIAFLVGLVLFLRLVRPLVRWWKARRHTRIVRLEVSATETATAASEIFREAVHAAFARFLRSRAIVESRLAIRDRGLSYFTDCEHLLPAAEGIDMQVTVGPVRFGNLTRVLSLYTGAKEFVLRISAVQRSASSYSVFASLSLNQTLWHTWRDEVAPDQVDSFCQRLVREVVWVTSCRSASEAQLIGYWRQSELDLLEGIELLSTYLMKPADVCTLEQAATVFERARRQPWAFQADLLGAIALSLAQTKPREATERMHQLREEYRHLGDKQAVLLYNNAVAMFRLYDIDGDSKHYDEAVELFKQIKQPRWRWRWVPIHKRAKAHDWTLYLLAQTGISNCLAHKLNVVEETDKGQIIKGIRSINSKVTDQVNGLRKLLGPATDEVEWRIFNAEAVTELFGSLRAKRGIEAAQGGLRIDPYSLPLQANLGSLFLLEAQQAEKGTDIEERTKSLKKAEQVFLSLRATGWDPGFVSYRLGRIRRLQGDFSQAIELLESAKNKDVDNQKIEAEMTKAQAGNSKFDC